MYTFESRIRYSETNREGFLSMEGLLDYFQDCSTFHSEDLGLGIEYLNRKHMLWVLSAWQIVVNRYPKLCERVEVGTFPYDFKGFMGYRNFFLKDAQGEFLAVANSIWTLVDTDTFKPVRPTESMLEGYVLEPMLSMEYAPRKIAVPEGGAYREPIEVKTHHLDTNRHVNNGQYVRMAMDFLPEDVNVKQLRAEYKMQARLGDCMKPYVVQDGERYGISLRDGEEKPYVNIEFIVNGLEKPASGRNGEQI